MGQTFSLSRRWTNCPHFSFVGTMSTLHSLYAKIFSRVRCTYSQMLLTYFFKHKPQELHVIYRGMKKAFVSYKLKNLLFFLLCWDNWRRIEEAVLCNRNDWTPTKPPSGVLHFTKCYQFIKNLNSKRGSWLVIVVQS